MSFTANIRTTSHIKHHHDNFFNYNWDAIGYFLNNKCEESYLSDDAGLMYKWEISIKDLNQVIKYLETRNPEDIIGSITVSSIIETFKRWLELQEKNKANLDNPDYIIIDWF